MSSDRANASRQRRDLIELKLTEAYHQAHGAESGQDLRKAGEMQREILDMLKDKTQPMLREDHEACWNRWLENKETLQYRRKEISDFNYGKFRGEAFEAKGLAEDFPKEAKAKIRDIQRDLKGRTMERWQFDEINAILNDAYRIAIAALERRHAAWQERQQERERKHQEWRERIDAAKSRKLALLEKNRDTIISLEHQINHCRDMLRNARSSEFEARVQSWIDEKYDKIRDIERFNAELDDQVREIDTKLSE